MPWLVNVTKGVLRTAKADGTYVGFGPREKVFVPDSQMSVGIAELLNSKKLRRRGSGQELQIPQVQEEPPREVLDPDPVEVAVVKVAVEEAASEDEESDMLDISDIEGQPQTDSGDGAPGRKKRRRRKRQ